MGRLTGLLACRTEFVTTDAARDSGMLLQEVVHRLGLMRRKVVEDDAFRRQADRRRS